LIFAHLTNGDFANDVNDLVKIFDNPKETIDERVRVVLTDDPIDLLLCGSDVGGSCQRLEGSSYQNKGLLGYIMDGKNRLLAIKDARGKIVARCLLKLLWDGKRPVIYRERIYSNTMNPVITQALDKASIQIAQEFNIPLTCAYGVTHYGKPLQALGGPAPYEYSDGSGKVEKDGNFTIKNAMVMG
jgi:hypothetical protein